MDIITPLGKRVPGNILNKKEIMGVEYIPKEVFTTSCEVPGQIQGSHCRDR